MAKKSNLGGFLGARSLHAEELKETLESKMSHKVESKTGQTPEPSEQPKEVNGQILEKSPETGENTDSQEMETLENTYSEERQERGSSTEEAPEQETAPEQKETPAPVANERIQGKKKKGVDFQTQKRISPQQVSLDDDVHKTLKLAGALTGKDMRTLVREALEKHPDYQKAKKSFS